MDEEVVQLTDIWKLTAVVVAEVGAKQLLDDSPQQQL
jgi:hypothetical protein